MNSPLVPIFRRGFTHFRENGIENELVLEWFGKGIIKEVEQPEGFALTFGRIVLVLIIVACMYTCSLIVFSAELSFKGHVKRRGLADTKQA